MHNGGGLGGGLLSPLHRSELVLSVTITIKKNVTPVL